MCRGRYLLQVLKLERLLEQRTWRSAVYTSAGRRGNCQTFEWAAVVNGLTEMLGPFLTATELMLGPNTRLCL